jgi:predicted nuclease of predicted toxin-antitoxin system
LASFLIDEDLPRSIAARAGRQGIDAVHAVDVGLRGAADAVVLAAALADERTVVTADKEFGNVLTYPPQQHAGVVLVRISDSVDADLRTDRVCEVLASLAQEDLRGVIVIVEATRLRIRRLRA